MKTATQPRKWCHGVGKANQISVELQLSGPLGLKLCRLVVAFTPSTYSHTRIS
jgi:hypothetical protein